MVRDALLEKHLLAGVDERERGFSRPVEIARHHDALRARFQYETRVLESVGAESAAALAEIVRVLHRQGYRQLKTRLIVLGDAYLGNRELWVDYPDPDPPPATTGGWAGLVRSLREAFTRRP